MNSSEKDLRDILALKKNGKGRLNYSIKAGAGGGKTTLLSTRISRQIAEGTPIEEFVIITYTNAAAAELRDKISMRLNEIATSQTADETEKKNAAEALNSIELMQISTIHAFLLKVLREYAFETGIVLDAKMLESEENEARKADFFNKWYSENFDAIRNRFKDDWTIPVERTGKDRDVTREVLFNMFRDIANIRESIVYDTTDHSVDFDQEAKKYVSTWVNMLVAFKNDLIKNRPTKKDGDPKKLLKDTEDIINKIADVEGAYSGGINNIGCEEAVTLSLALKKIYEFEKKEKSFYGKSEDDSMITRPAFPACDLDWDFDTLYNTYMILSQKASKAAEYVQDMQKEYQKENDGETLVLSNDDILFRADKLIMSHPEVLDKIRKNYSKIYVDEFQDTTGLQAKLVKMISEKTGTDMMADELQDDKLIVVGDPKQSIYRFTGAEKTVYDGFDAMMDGKPDTNADSVSLDTNFRSNKDIVEWVNDKFSKLMTTGYSNMDTDWDVQEKNALHGVYRYVANLGNDDKGNPVKYKRDDDVTAVVNLIKKLVGNVKCFVEEPVRNADGTFGVPFLREIKYSDIMVICKNTTRIDNYVKAFAASGIPVNVQGKFMVSNDEILRNFVLLTEYLSGKKNKKSRIAAAQVYSGFDATGVDKADLKKAEDDLRALKKYFRDNSMDSAAIMRYLLEHEELFLPKGKTQSVERVREYRIRLNQMVETCLMKCDGDMSQFSELMNVYIEGEIKREIPLESNEDAVRLMNVHQSKGLTGQIVIIADRSNPENCRYSGFKNNGKYYPTVSYKESGMADGKNKLIPTYGWDVNRMKQAWDEESAEAIRLQYVAATRAAHALIIMPVVFGNTYPNAWFSDKIYHYDSLKDVNEWIAERENDTKTYNLKSASSGISNVRFTLKQLESNKASVNLDILSKRQLVSITPSGLEPAGVTGFQYGDEGFVKEKRPGANVFGTVMHRVYELMFCGYELLNDLNASERSGRIERLVNMAILESKDDMRPEDDPKDFSEYLMSKMPEYFEKVIVPVMKDAEEIYPEYAFSFYVADEERADFVSRFSGFLENAKEKTEIGSETIWVNGKADLVVRKKDGSIKVYDYKSDAMNGKPADEFVAAMKKKYEGQLALYEYAIGKAFEVSNVDTELIDLYRF